MSVPEPVADRIADARLSAHLATGVDDRPHVAPVWYVYEDGTLYTMTGGKKLRNLRDNPRVAVSIERYDADGVDWAAQLLGTARVVDDEAQVAAMERRIGAKYEGPYATDGGDSQGRLVAIEIGSATVQQY